MDQFSATQSMISSYFIFINKQLFIFAVKYVLFPGKDALQNWNPAAQRSNEEGLFLYFEEITGRLFFSQTKFVNLLENSHDYSYEYFIFKCIEVCS